MRNICGSITLACLLLGCGGDRDGTDSNATSDGGTSSGAASTSGSSVTDGGSSGSTGGAPAACFDYASFDGASPAVSFKTDVLPLFQRSCGFSVACHNALGNPAQPYLGPPMSETVTAQNIDDIFMNIIDVAAAREPGMARVKPGDPERSFLMYKLDGLLTCETLACAADKSCGGPMPEASPTLPQDERDAIRRWIAQGAQNN